MRTVLEILDLSHKYLQSKGLDRPRRQAEELIADVLQLKRIDLYLQFDRPLNEEELMCCREALQRKGKREPQQYIRGFVEFLDAKIKVNSHVLIPRQETEILADAICSFLSNKDLKGKRLWDICTGSGCLAIAIKKKFPELEVEASDLSIDALNVAKENALLNECAILFHQGDLFSPFKGKRADFIVSNPPYISEEDYQALEEEVRRFEPKMALVGGKTGYEFYQTLAENLENYLYPQGKLWLEIGHNQKQTILELFNHQGSIEKDWSGLDRFFSLEF